MPVRLSFEPVRLWSGWIVLLLFSSSVSAKPRTPQAGSSLAAVGAVAGDAARGDSAAQRVEVGVISLSRYQAAFEAGPQPLIASIRVYPARRDGRFIGFEIREILSGSPLEGGAVQVGDIICSANGAPIGRPADFMRALERARARTSLELEVERGGRRLKLRWKIAASSGE
ncbi:MAG: PDZ domain-containing protein [Myxococcota bacterium]|nr:PDZ domain-containing protein [Myxococcota bacterium]